MVPKIYGAWRLAQGASVRVGVTQNGYIGPHQTASFYPPKRRYVGLGPVTTTLHRAWFLGMFRSIASRVPKFGPNVMWLNRAMKAEWGGCIFLRKYAA
jgi:hypothetical protein